MMITLHKKATTTPAVRAQIQQSSASEYELAQQYGIGVFLALGQHLVGPPRELVRGGRHRLGFVGHWLIRSSRLPALITADLAPWMSSVRRWLSPRLVMRRTQALPPVEF